MRRASRWWIGIVAGTIAVGLTHLAFAALVVDNFDKAEKPNALGGDYGSWNKDEGDPTQKCVNSYDKEHALGGVGYSLRLDYDVDSPNPAYNGFWMKLQDSDLHSYRQLSFYIRGDAAKGYTTQIKLELKNTKEVGRYLLKGVTDQWQKVSIPLKEFAGLTEWSKMTELVVVFDDLNSTKKAGTLYLDEIAFE